MPILLENFPEYIRKQLSIRQELVGMTNGKDGQGGRFRDFNTSVLGQTWPDTLTQLGTNKGAFFNYTANRQCTIRMSSGVDITNKNILESWEQAAYGTGKKLAEHWVLEGGQQYRPQTTADQVSSTKSSARSGVTTDKIGTGKAYGDLTARANASDSYGIVPMAGIVDVNVRTRTAFGSLRDAKVHFKCHNRRQLEVLELLYMRPGYPVLLEWGWAPYISNKGKVENQANYITDEIFKTGATYEGIEKSIRDHRESLGGNYDGLLGYVKNYNYKVRDDGGYDCFVEIVSANEVIESLKTPKTPRYLSTVYKNHTDIKPPDDMTIQDYEDDLLLLFRALNNYNKFDEIKRKEKGQEQLYDDDGTLLTEYPDQIIISATEQSRRDNYQSDLTEKYDTARKKLTSLDCISGYDWVMKKTPSLSGTGVRKRTEERRSFNLWQSIWNTSKNAVLGQSNDAIVFEDYTYDVDDVKTPFSFIKLDALLKYINNEIIPKQQVNENNAYLAFQSNRIIKKNTLKTEIAKVPAILSNYWSDIVLDPETLDMLDGYAFGDVIGDQDTQTRYVDNLNFSINAGVCITPHQMKKHFHVHIDTTQADSLPSSGTSDNSNIMWYQRPISLWNGFSSELGGKNATATQNEALFKNSKWCATAKDNDFAMGNIWINTQFLQSLYEGKIKSFLDKGETPEINLGDLIADILGNVKNSFGGLRDFQLQTNNEYSNIVEVVENNHNPGNLDGKYKPDPDKEFELEILGTKSICKSFEYFSSIPNSLSSTIAVLAQNPDSIENLDDATFKAFNRDIRNRLIEPINAPEKTLNTSEAVNFKSRVKKYISSLAALKNHLDYDMWTQSFREYPSNSNNSQEVAKASQIMSSAIAELQFFKQVNWTKLLQNNKLELKGDKSLTSIASLIPLKFTGVIDGIGGITKNTLFKLPKDRLPKAYQNADIKFVVHNEEQSISAGQEWTTTLGGQMVFTPVQSSRSEMDIDSINEITEKEKKLIEKEVEEKNNEIREISFKISKNTNKMLGIPYQKLVSHSILNNILNSKELYYNWGELFVSYILQQDVEIGPFYREEYDDMIARLEGASRFNGNVAYINYPGIAITTNRPTYTSEGFIKFSIHSPGICKATDGAFGTINYNHDSHNNVYGSGITAGYIMREDGRGLVKLMIEQTLVPFNVVPSINKVGEIVKRSFRGPITLLGMSAPGIEGFGGDEIVSPNAGSHGLTNTVMGLGDFTRNRRTIYQFHAGSHGLHTQRSFAQANSFDRQKTLFTDMDENMNRGIQTYNFGMLIKQTNTEVLAEEHHTNRAILVGQGMDGGVVSKNQHPNCSHMDNYIYECLSNNDPLLAREGITKNEWESDSEGPGFAAQGWGVQFNKYDKSIQEYIDAYPEVALSFGESGFKSYDYKQLGYFALTNIKYD
tara:strand:+ start:7116 stop:11348 length:4233 start_codon:yes stop_codon:yes gene_type:complete